MTEYKTDASRKPPTLAVIPANIPEPIRSSSKCVGWRWEFRDGKWTKPPVDVKTGGYAKVAGNGAQATWSSFDKAIEVYQDPNRDFEVDGIGYVLTLDDGITVIDCDGVRDPETGEVLWDAESIVRTSNTYAEDSVTGSGEHIVLYGKLPPKHRRADRIEMYMDGRYITFTGHLRPLSTATIEKRQAQLDAFFQHVFAEKIAKDREASKRPKSVPDNLSLSDNDLLIAVEKHKNGALFQALYHRGDISIYGDDESRADLALCNMLAFLTGNDEDRMDRMFRSSALYREKWDRPDYKSRTIRRACIDTTAYYSPKQPRSRSTSSTARSRDAAPIVDEQDGSAVETQESHDPSEPRDKYHLLTDTANARRFVGQHHENVRYDHSRKIWYVWDGTRWKPDAMNKVQEMAKDTARSIYREAAECREDDFRVELAKHAKSSLNVNRLNAMVRLSESDPAVSVIQSNWDSDSWSFNVLNGTLNLRTGKLRPHDRADMITKISPVVFDPAATCPRFDAFLERILPQEETRGFAQRMVGYSLTGDMSEQLLVYKYGTGANGKSVFTEIIKNMMGDYGYKSDRKVFMVSPDKSSGNATPELTPMVGKRFISVSEVEQSDRLNESRIKDLTGTDTISARDLYSSEFNFFPSAKLWFYGNHKPRITGEDDGIWRRFRLLPFTVQIPENERDRKLLEKLQAELPGILNWAVKGCLAWQQNGLQIPDEVVSATADYRQEQDVVGSFISDRCIVASHAVTISGELYRAYVDWCKENGEYSKSQHFFGMTLKKRGFEAKRTGLARKWQGIGLLTKAEMEYRNSVYSDTVTDSDTVPGRVSIETPHMENSAGSDVTKRHSVTPELPFDAPTRKTEVIN